MWNLIKMEYNGLQLTINKKHILLIVIIPIMFRFLKFAEIEESYIVLSFSFTVLISHYILGIERPESHYLINSLPISKSKLVFGKHIFIHLCLLAAWIYLAIYFAAMKVVEFKNLDINYLQTSMILAVIILNVMISIINGPKYIAGISNIIILTFSLRFLTDLEVINRFSEYTMYIILLALLSIGISLLISIFFYNKREFARM